MPGGRPLKLSSPINAPTEAAPDRRIPVGEYICEEMEATGLRAELCARAAGVGRSTVEGWLRDGSAAEVKADKGFLLYPNEQRLLQFLRNTRLSHARWARKRLDLHHQIAAGGLTIAEVTQEVDPTQETVRADGSRGPKVLKTRTKSTRLLPDKAALEWELERLARDDDGNRILAPRVEVTGADGSELMPVDPDQAEAAKLIAEFEAFSMGVEEGRAREAEARPANGSSDG